MRKLATQLFGYIKKHDQFFLFLGILGLALVLRLVNLGVEPYWGDEVLSLDIVHHYSRDFLGMLNYVGNVEVHPPLYYIILFFWTRIFGFAEFGVKLLSLIFGMGIVGLSFYAGKIFFQSRKYLPLLLPFILAVLPIQLEYSQEARPYIIFCFFAFLSMIMLWQFLETRKTRYFIIFTLSAVIGLYLHYSFVFALISLFLFWFINILFFDKNNKSRKIVEMLASGTLISLAFFPWLKYFLYKIFLADYSFLGVSRTVSIFTLKSRNFLETTCSNLVWLTEEKDISSVDIFAVFIFKAVLIIIFFYLIFNNDVKAYFKENLNKFIYFTWLFVVPIVLFLFSPYSVYYTAILERHIIYSSIALTMIFVFIVGAIKNWKVVVLLISLFLVSIFSFDARVLMDDSIWETEHRMKFNADFINSLYKQDDLIIIRVAFARTDFNHFLRKDIEAQGFFPPFSLDNDSYRSRETLGFMENEFQLRMSGWDNNSHDRQIDYLIKKYKPKRIWLAYFGNFSYIDHALLERGFQLIMPERKLLQLKLYEKIPDNK